MHRRRCAKHSRLPQSGCAETMATELETRNPQAASPLQGERLREALRLMLTIRFFDERALALYRAGEMRGTTHPYIGMEAVGVGVMLALQPNDYVTSTHRGHGHTIAKGGDPRKMMAELLGRATGYSGGKGGSMHIADMDKHMLGANGIVGGGMDLLAVNAKASEFVERARGGEGPAYLVCNTYRFHGHHAGDPLNYREKEEVERWRLQDPIEKAKRVAIDSGAMTEAEYADLEQ